MVQLDGFAIVTGAASGIGRDCAIAFAAEGAAGILLADINKAAVEEAAEVSKQFATNPAYRAIAFVVDVSSDKSVRDMVDSALAAFGQIDYSVNSAGIGVQIPNEIAETVLDEFQNFFEVNVKGTLLCVREVSRVMKLQGEKTVLGRGGPRTIGRGAIVNIASCSSYVATPGIVQYTAAKHAVMGITKTAAIDNAKYGIRVNAVCPSWVDTPMVDRAISANPDLGIMISRAVPLGRIAQQQEVSDIVIFLSGPGASYVTGVGWIVDGGTTLQGHV
ncbi:hypothetical protein MMC25_005059 [Agyrium rufum]|nr:hypothetical protein [Agyrium rufum]